MKPNDMQDIMERMWKAERERLRKRAERIMDGGTEAEQRALFKPLLDAIRNQHGKPHETA